jgi:hypothetical protein
MSGDDFFSWAIILSPIWVTWLIFPFVLFSKLNRLIKNTKKP